MLQEELEGLQKFLLLIAIHITEVVERFGEDNEASFIERGESICHDRVAPVESFRFPSRDLGFTTEASRRNTVLEYR